MPRKKHTEGQIALVVKELENGAVEETMRNWPHDYNHVRPHRSLRGVPPSYRGEQITHDVCEPLGSESQVDVKGMAGVILISVGASEAIMGIFMISPIE